jgi:hypothetical protein
MSALLVALAAGFIAYCVYVAAMADHQLPGND